MNARAFTRWSTLCAVALACAAPSLAAPPDRRGPHRPERIPTPVLVDPSRDRPLETRVTVPSGPGAFPVVVMSHGLGGNLSSHQHIVDHLVSHGYAILAPNHPASDTLRVFRKRTRYSTGPKPGLDPAAVLGRAPDVTYLLDVAKAWAGDPEHPLFRRLDLSRVGAAGHSFGAFTVLTVCGARPVLDHLQPSVPPGRGLAPSMRDPRVQVGIAYSPQGPGSGFFSEQSYASIETPLLAFSGSRDRQGNNLGRPLPARNRFRVFELMPARDKYYAWLIGAGHMGWADSREAGLVGRIGQRFMAPEQDDVVRISAALSVAFLDRYLKEDPRAARFLTREYAQGLRGRRVRRIHWSTR